MKDFFFDTANVDAIKKYWASIKDYVDPKSIRGITTNPNAFFKLDKLSLKSWLDTLPYLCEIVSEIRQDSQGVVFIQGPSSEMSFNEICDFIDKVSLHTDSNTELGIKIPPFNNILKYSYFGNLHETQVNVTGVADCSTALKCLTYKPRYISIIPGRMEEVGIDAKAHIDYTLSGKMGDTEIIAGSMRTIEGLFWTFQHGTIPTIGEKVWDILLQKDNFTTLMKEIEYPYSNVDRQFSPLIDQCNIDLSFKFFEQMDKCGQQAYSDFKQ